MIVDPMEALARTSLLVPSSPTTTSYHPLPTFHPEPPTYEHVHRSGKTALWVVFAIMLVATLLFTALSWMIPVSKRIFHILTTLITLIATLSYFSMATSHAVLYHHTVVHTPVSHAPIRLTHDIYRQVFWAHYVDWALSTPLVLLDLALLAGLSGAHTLLAVVADVVMVLCGLFAALGQHGTGQRWGWFAFACVAFLAVVWQLVVNGRRVAVARGGDAGRFYQALAAYTVVVWLAYPIIWGVVSGSRRLSVDGEVIAYGVLDVLAKVVFGAVLLGAHMVTPELGVEVGGFWANGLNKEGMVRLPEEQENGG